MAKIIAILGGSGSGKTALSLELAGRYDSVILSLDSLSIYKEINIASAKPSVLERGEILHFGIDILSPSVPQNVQNFIAEFLKAKDYCAIYQKNLLIVGGSGFYLKALLNGLSKLPKRDENVALAIQKIGDLEAQYAFLSRIDDVYAKALKPKDIYRITRALEIYFLTQEIPSVYFAKNPPKPFLMDCEIFEILLPREILHQRIAERTQQMLKRGLIAEVEFLTEKYGIAQQWARSIGIKEVLEYKAQNFDIKTLESLIATHTAQLAKRQRTFNKTQFKEHFCGDYLQVFEEIKKCLEY